MQEARGVVSRTSKNREILKGVVIDRIGLGHDSDELALPRRSVLFNDFEAFASRRDPKNFATVRHNDVLSSEDEILRDEKAGPCGAFNLSLTFNFRLNEYCAFGGIQDVFFLVPLKAHASTR
jgi:hypothetical protein